jgi:hypothetical protein
MSEWVADDVEVMWGVLDFIRDERARAHVLAAMLAQHANLELSAAVRGLSCGNALRPGGLEGLGMAIAGNGLREPLGSAVGRVADALQSLGRSDDE